MCQNLCFPFHFFPSHLSVGSEFVAPEELEKNKHSANENRRNNYHRTEVTLMEKIKYRTQ